MNKQEKIEYIVNFMQGKSFSSQTQLVNKLNNSEINQPFISRNIDEIGIEKKEGVGYVLKEDFYLKKVRRTLENELNTNDVEISEPVFITLRVNDGTAERIAYLLKESFPEEIVGTMNQRNNILVFLENEEAKTKILDEGLNHLNLK